DWSVGPGAGAFIYSDSRKAKAQRGWAGRIEERSGGGFYHRVRQPRFGRSTRRLDNFTKLNGLRAAKRSLANAKPTKNFAQQIVGAERPGNRRQLIVREAQFLGKEFPAALLGR